MGLMSWSPWAKPKPQKHPTLVVDEGAFFAACKAERVEESAVIRDFSAGEQWGERELLTKRVLRLLEATPRMEWSFSDLRVTLSPPFTEGGLRQAITYLRKDGRVATPCRGLIQHRSVLVQDASTPLAKREPELTPPQIESYRRNLVARMAVAMQINLKLTDAYVTFADTYLERITLGLTQAFEAGLREAGEVEDGDHSMHGKANRSNGRVMPALRGH